MLYDKILFLIFLHTDKFIGKCFSEKINCDQFSKQKGVGGYMKGVGVEQQEPTETRV